jgi:hypothetical protein
MSQQWTSVTLKGKSQVIPNVCPATLRPATHSLRYGYSGPLYFINRTTYYQTFFYAADAAQAVQHWLKHSNRRFWIWLLGIVLGVPGIYIAFYSLPFLRPALPILNYAAIPLIIALCVYLTHRSKRAAQARGPKPSDAVRWGPSVYYTGSGLHILGNAAVFKALRPEWIRALVEANPEQVDDATYARITGSARPVPDGRKPFA